MRAAGKIKRYEGRLKALLVSIPLAVFTPEACTSPREILHPLPPGAVTLGEGRMKAQVDETRAFYLAIANDDLLKGFRQRAGLPAPGNNLGGWYSSDTFHVFGQIVSGLARLYAATGDAACCDKANTLITEWGKCVATNGYFYYSTRPNAPHYTYDKMLGGLLDAHIYCGSTNALEYMSRITDWAIANLDRSRIYADTATEWYTLSENLYRAYQLTGQDKYRFFAHIWEYTDYWNIYLAGGDIFAPRPGGGQTRFYHAYSHVNTLNGAGAGYLALGNPNYLTLLTNAYDFLRANEVLVTGGYGPDEQLLPRSNLVSRLYTSAHTFETQCGSWAVFKLVRYLMTLTGDARYGDWVEELCYNGVGASLPTTADGRVFYYSNYQVDGARKQNHPVAWTCCTGTRPQVVADYASQVFLQGDEALYVNLFTPATVRWNVNGQEVTVSQETAFPEENLTTLSVAAAAPVAFSLKIRTPGWLAGPMTATLNGQPLVLSADSWHWTGVTRVWSPGDRLVISLPQTLTANSISASQPYPAAVRYGPVTLAFEAPSAALLGGIDLDAPKRSLLPVPGQPLTWQLAGDSSLRARPFYTYTASTPYFLYFDPVDDLDHPRVKYQGNWLDAGPFRYAREAGVTATYTFYGIRVHWLGYKFDDAGLAQVLIDGSAVATVDQYGPGRNLPFEWSSDDLFPGWHTIQIRVLGQHNPPALNHYINVAGFHAIGPPPSAVLVNRYSFATDASDSVGGQHGTLVGGAVITNGAVVMDGIKPGYVNLPNGLGATLTNYSIETWVTVAATHDWQRIFDFGWSTAGEDVQGQGSNTLFLTTSSPVSGAAGVGVWMYTKPQAAYRTNVVAGPALTLGTRHHIVLTYAWLGTTARLYVDGFPVATNRDIAASLAGLGPTVNNWLGHSQFSTDADFNGAIHEFRLYDGVLTPVQVMANHAAGPDVVTISKPSLDISLTNAQVLIAWPAEATGFSLESSLMLEAATNWSPVTQTPVLSNGQHQILLAPHPSAHFYRLRR